MKIKEITSFDRPRERLRAFGVSALSDAELIAILIQTGTSSLNAVDLSHKLISKFGLKEMFEASYSELVSVYGVGEAKACKILSAYEIVKRANSGRIYERTISCASDVANHYMTKLSGLKQEHLIVVLLDSAGKVIRDSVVSVGTLNSSLVHPREVFKLAIRESANSIILVHNHPSGSVIPSDEDFLVSSKISEAGRVFGIELLDHLIVGDGYWSWRDG